ncbi:MAG: AAA family ATPase, partial [Patescibacteria group bacterium]
MRLTSIELSGFKSFAKKTELTFGAAITAVVGPNGSGKSNVAESFRFVLGEQSMKSMRGRRGEDLIWNGSASSPRAGRAGVKLIFDNPPVGGQRALNLDFDEVAIERVVHRDGSNDYLLNGSLVRLRDINELLSQANIGASGHHIISQGEADRVLSASTRERREMLEDALGLTAYLYKREEATHKLEKTAENMHEVEALRRELAPHLKFLGAQVKKIEEAKLLRDTLLMQYLEYFKRENVYLHAVKADLAASREAPEEELRRLEKSIARLREELNREHGKDKDTKELMTLESEGRAAVGRRNDISRELGRIEGELIARRALSQEEGTVPAREAREFGERVLKNLEDAFALGEVEGLKRRISEALALAKAFLATIAQSARGGSTTELEDKKSKLERELAVLQTEEERVAAAIAALRRKIESDKDASRQSERELFAAMARRSELEA